MALAANSIDFEATEFTSQRDAAPRLLAEALASLADRAAPVLLDLGCGTGALAIAAAQEHPTLRAVAIDISAANVRAARAAADAAGVGDRVETICVDYLLWEGRRFDAIVSDSVLHLIVGSDEKLAVRLAADLVPCGILVATVPINNSANSLRYMLRHLWRLMPQAADQLVLAVASKLYPHVPVKVIADRVPYLRLLPERLYGKTLRALFARHGLEVISERPSENPSIAKPDHCLVVWLRHEPKS
jgi:trans-aconitate 2-methyltransferase